MKSKIILLLIVNCTLLIVNCFSQGVSVNSSGNPADNSAILDVESLHAASPKGLLIPRMTTAQRDAISSPALSLLIFNTTTNCFEAYVNGSWYSLSCPPPCSPPLPPASGIRIPASNSIIWNWNSVSGATGYKWSTSSNYATASDNGTSVSYTQTGLVCNTSYSLYVWAYNSCGNSSASALTPASTSACVCTAAECGSQVFMCKNLNAGTQVPNSTPQAANQKWCYNDNPANCDIYGGYYTWSVVTGLAYGSGGVNCDPCGPTTGHGGAQGMCPAGFHVPSDLEWSRYEYCVEGFIYPAGETTLAAFQTGTNWRGSAVPGVGPGSKMKAASADNPPWDGTNASGFTALSGGDMSESSFDMGLFTIFWVATEDTPGVAWDRHLWSGYAQSERSSINGASFGFSIRCLKD
jgi:uncharacterized protein (TIGR02145 family)